MPVNRWLLNLMFALLLLIYPAGPAAGEVKVYPETIRVGILQDVPSVTFDLSGMYRLVDENSGKVIADNAGESSWTAEAGRAGIVLMRNGSLYGEYVGPVIAEEKKVRFGIETGDGSLVQHDNLLGFAVSSGSEVDLRFLGKDTGTIYYVDGSGEVNRLAASESTGLVSINKNNQQKPYRGSLEIRRIGSLITAINELPIEEYLYGVVPAEMPVMFPIEALKAQAVTARSYIISQLGSYASYGFDVLDNQSNNIYGGFNQENPVSTRAVEETRGLVLVYRGQPVAAFYHASSGGFTDNSEDVWTNALGYIKAKPDPADANDKYYHWSVTYSASQLAQMVNSQLKTYWPDMNSYSSVTDLQEIESTAGGRVKKLLILGMDTNGSPQQVMVFNAERVRTILSLKSAMFTLSKTDDPDGNLSSVTITGNGWGHGLGMSQWGAAGLAGQGYSFQDILQYYYTGVDLVTYYGK
ncbi:stage II sporulation protein D [Desulfotomaculum arcticum]|uniref:Stage II sporulation protein D n=1 Tax=Desulfotruncus arcticus DSM 17038 TaxID=1121424 RepID=A0A1I2SLS9_9FIRM|nr:SpoIID/LytB domain-containing protein [Desulfotruncus arcticus]SFG51226.1 stage II sporulation protein D [Desulfotomaculum arcticum] [Desulfotruncus arcticus DSM 17038]